MKTYLRVKNKYGNQNRGYGNVVRAINFKQAIRLTELKAKGLIPQNFYTYKYDEYKAIILDLKAKGLIE